MSENEEEVVDRLSLLDRIATLERQFADYRQMNGRITQKCLTIANVSAGNPADCCRALLRDLETARRERDEKAVEVANLRDRLVGDWGKLVDDREFILMLSVDDSGYSVGWKGRVLTTCNPAERTGLHIIPVEKSTFMAYIDKCGAISTDLATLPDPKNAKSQVLQCSWIPMRFTNGKRASWSVDQVVDSLLEEIVAWWREKADTFPEHTTALFLRAFSRRFREGVYRYQASCCVFTY